MKSSQTKYFMLACLTGDREGRNLTPPVAAVVVIVDPALSVVVIVAPPAPTAPVPVAVLFPVIVSRVVEPDETMVTTVGLVPLPAPVAVLRTEAPVRVAVVTEPALSVVVKTTTTPVVAPVPLPAAVPEGADPAPNVVVKEAPVLSVPVLTTTVLVPADSVAVTVDTLVPAEDKAAVPSQHPSQYQRKVRKPYHYRCCYQSWSRWQCRKKDKTHWCSRGFHR